MRRRAYKLPKWVYSKFPTIYDKVSMYSVPMDGHCFFKSVQIILNSIDYFKTVQDLRKVVSESILDVDDSLTTSTIESWVEIYKSATDENDIELMNEYNHVKNLRNATLPLDMKDRELLSKDMMRSIYWGEEHACRIIEEKTKMRFLIINDDIESPSMGRFYNDNYKPGHYAILFLSCNHYSPVSINGRFIFTWEDIPYEFKKFMSEGY